MVLIGAATASSFSSKPCRAILASAFFFFDASCCLSGGGLFAARGRKLKLHSMAAAILTLEGCQLPQAPLLDPRPSFVEGEPQASLRVHVRGKWPAIRKSENLRDEPDRYPPAHGRRAPLTGLPPHVPLARRRGACMHVGRRMHACMHAPTSVRQAAPAATPRPRQQTASRPCAYAGGGPW
jgi:hypothetical protein